MLKITNLNAARKSYSNLLLGTMVVVVLMLMFQQSNGESSSTNCTTGCSLRDWLASLQSEASTLQNKSYQLEKSIALLVNANYTNVQVRISQLGKVKKALEMLNLEIQVIDQACSTMSGPNCDVALCDSKCLKCISSGQCSLCSGNWTGPTCSTCKTGWTGANCGTVDTLGELASSSILTNSTATRFVTDLISGVQKNPIKLLFKSSRDGFSCVNNLAPSKFQTQVSNKGPTFVIFKGTSGAIFGAYTSVNFTSACQYVSDKSAFLFSIQSETGAPRFTKLTTLDERFSVMSCSNAYFGFGNGFDLFYGCIENGLIGRTIPGSFVNLGQYYLTGSHVPFSTTGSTFSVTDFEVYSL